MLALLALLACSDKDGTSADDTAPSSTEQVWPDQEKVLFYYGMGGRSGGTAGEGGTDDASAWVEETYGWHTNQRDNIGEPETFRAVLFMDIGAFGGGYSEQNVSDLLGAMEVGTRLIFLAGRDTCDGELLNPLLTELGAPMQLNGERYNGVAQVVGSGDHQIVDGVGEVYLNEPCDMETNGAEPLFVDGREVFGAVYRPGYGGDIVLLGDYNFLDDTGRLDNGDNAALLGQLVEVVPGF